jgi:putative copper resistance protein D
MALIATLAWTGHAAATEPGRRLLHLAADAVHLVGTGLWLGGLLPLALLLRRVRTLPPPLAAEVSGVAISRFSALALGCVAAVGTTGLVQSWILVGDVPHLAGTPYGRLLLAKVALLLPLLGIASRNLLRWKPQLLAMSTPGERESLRRVLGGLARNVVAEASLGGLILLVVGVLGILPPARHLPPSWPLPFRLDWSAAGEPATWAAITVGSLGALLGVLAAGYGILRAQHRPWAIGAGIAMLIASAAIPLTRLAERAYPTTYLRSPIPYEAASIARGLQRYQETCAACHGASGRGDGPAGRGLRPPPPGSLIGPHVVHHTAGDLFWWVSHGIPGTAMPSFGERLSETDRWDLINFLRALAAGDPARRLGPRVAARPEVVAPDFTAGMGVGAEETLKESRGQLVLLVFFDLPGSLPRLEQLSQTAGLIALAGARILAVPQHDPDRVYRELGPHATNLRILPAGSAEAVEAYGLFRRSPRATPAPHTEFLIDRQGYLRARWSPGEAPGWTDMPDLMVEIKRLAQEPSQAPLPDEHVH